ncbi:MAG TPA: FG-GAP-like repeat-containing protein, partial [Myxococcota bacterium]|nr:FG-GAP-like repeat-containing protein [Myxococcota bacterium]
GQFAGGFFTYENTGNATSPAFVARTGNENPLTGQGAGFNTIPALVDFDRDGDLDVVAGNNNGTFALFDSFADRFARILVHPFAGTQTSTAPALGDLDGDGDLDYFLGRANGTIVYFQNVGSAKNPSFLIHSTSGNPLDGVDVGSYAHPALGDFDDDGDLDLIIGAGDGTFFTFGNTGSASSPAFFAVTGGFNPLFGRDVGYMATPALADLDRDGDLDLVAGEYDGVFNYFQNTGGTFFPQFVPRTGSSNPLDGFDVGRASAPAIGDLERDGDLDVVAGAEDGTFRYIHNFGTATTPSFGQNYGLANPMDREDVGSYAKPSLGDFDGDGDLDLVSGNSSGFVIAYRSSIAQVPLSAVALTGAANPLLGQDVGALARPALADLDADGDADLLVGEYGGTFLYYENTGSALSPKFAARTGSANPLLGRDVGDAAAPAFADLDHDGDFDLVAGDLTGNFDYFENTGDAEAPAFASALANPFGLSRVDDASAPSFGDYDYDGDLDLLVGGYAGFAYFRNTGSATNPLFALQTGVFNPLLGESLTYASPALGDFDGDGDLDVYAGAAGGRFTYFVQPRFESDLVRVPGPANPLASTDLGSDSAPAAADLDGDGDLDLVTGNLAGTFAVHYLPEPAHVSMFAAGAALLGWLRRGRRGSDC